MCVVIIENGVIEQQWKQRRQLQGEIELTSLNVFQQRLADVCGYYRRGSNRTAMEAEAATLGGDRIDESKCLLAKACGCVWLLSKRESQFSNRSTDCHFKGR